MKAQREADALNRSQVGPVLRQHIADAVVRGLPVNDPVTRERVTLAVVDVVESALRLRKGAEDRAAGAKTPVENVAEVSGQEVLTRVLTYAIGMYGGRWMARRAARKRGAPDWAVDLVGRLTLLAGGRGWAEAANLDGGGSREVGKYLGERLVSVVAKVRR